METTRGAMSGGFQPLSQERDDFPTPSIDQLNDQTSLQDPLGVRHWPGLLKYLEDNFSFSAALLSIIGYVIMASFGAMRSIGQYLAYLLFLLGLMTIYHSNKRGVRSFAVLFIVSFGLLITIVIQNWSLITPVYRGINRMFEIELVTTTTST